MIKLTDTERLILRNQFELLQRLERTEKEVPDPYYAQMVEILDRGYEFDYQRLAETLSDPMPKEASREVIDILAMYEHLQRSESRLATRAKITPQQVAFPGFDGNDETEIRYMAYAQFLVDDHRFGHVVRAEENTFNSHMRMLPAYKAMLAKWKSYGARRDLTEAEILEILDRG